MTAKIPFISLPTIFLGQSLHETDICLGKCGERMADTSSSKIPERVLDIRAHRVFA